MSPAPARTSFLALDPDAAEAEVVRLGGRPFHARVVRRELIERGALDYAAMTALPAALRARLAGELPLLAGTEVLRTGTPDGTTKLLVELAAGGRVETVFMPSHDPKKGATLCVSTQVGCPVGCPFCASGLFGLERNLGAHEILEQYLRGRALGPLSRSVVMGIGEPLLNLRGLLPALRVVREELGLGARRITVSTVGFPDRLRRLAEDDPRFQLAISLHSPFDEERARLVPAMAGVPVEEVLAAGDHWFARTGREVTYEYVLLAGTNDDDEHARALADRLAQRRATVNLIPWNPIREASARPGTYARPEAAGAERFRAILARRGVVATVRWSRGVEADAACGQLRIQTG